MAHKENILNRRFFCFGASNMKAVIDSQLGELEEGWVSDRFHYKIINCARKGDKFTRERHTEINDWLYDQELRKTDILVLELLGNLVLGRENDDYKYSSEYIQEVAHRYKTFVKFWAEFTNVIAFGILPRRVDRNVYTRKTRRVVWKKVRLMDECLESLKHVQGVSFINHTELLMYERNTSVDKFYGKIIDAMIEATFTSHSREDALWDGSLLGK